MSFIKENPQAWFLACGALGVWILIMSLNPVRGAFRDGWRCVLRYGSLWSILALFGLGYAAFQLGLETLYYQFLPQSGKPLFQWERAWFFPPDMEALALSRSWLPALEGVAGIFNNVLATYPLSALAALLLLVNFDGHHRTLGRALRKRFGRGAWLLHPAVVLCALAALAKPALYAALPLLGRHEHALAWVQAAAIIDWLSFLFEYLLGVAVQIYLILLIYIWVRGMSFTRHHLREFAIRRFSAVMRWAVVVMVMSTVFIHLPLVLSFFPSLFPDWTPAAATAYCDQWARPAFALVLLACAAMQVTLTFHSETLWKAWRDHRAFVLENFGAFLWFLLIAAIHLFLLHWLNNVLRIGKGDGTAVIVAWRLAFPLVQAVVVGWLLASWVCFYQRSQHGRDQREDWLRF